MRTAISRNDSEGTGILVKDRDVVRCLKNLEWIRDAPGLRRNQGHAIGSGSRVGGGANDAIFFGIRLQYRSSGRAARTASACACAGVDTGKIGLAVGRSRNSLF